MARTCVVLNSQTSGLKNGVVECFGAKKDAADRARVLNKHAGMGKFYSVHSAAVIRSWRDRGDPGDWSMAGSRRRR